ncbi:MAG TPA: FAD-dependent oxidoreductase, partial [Candidatus Saccharimonadales bacterium]
MTQITSLRTTFSGTIITPADATYDTARKVYMAAGSPLAILVPATTKDIASAIAFARKNNLPLSVRSGGHSSMGHSTNNGGIVIDMSKFNAVTILNEADGLVRVGSGAVWSEVAKQLKPHSLVISAGDSASVGVGGLTVGGGIGIMVRKYGLAIDQLVGAEVVTADGRVLRASKDENADLFWGIRGGGGNFGIVTHFDFAAHHLRQVFFGPVMYKLDNLKGLLTGWRDTSRQSPRELTTTLVVMPGFGGNPPFGQLLFCYAGDDEVAMKKTLAPFLKIAPVVSQQITKMPYAHALQEAHPPAGLVPSVKDALIEHLDDSFIDIITTIYTNATNKMMFLRSLGGAVNEVPVGETAYAHRNHEALLVCAV